MKDTFFLIERLLACLGVITILFVAYNIVGDGDDDDDTVIIEYTCTEVFKSQSDYPVQVLRECKTKRGIPSYEGKV